MKWNIAVVVVCLIVAVTGVTAQQVVPADQPSREQVLKLLEVTQTKRNMDMVLQGTFKSFREQFVVGFKKGYPEATPEMLKDLDSLFADMFSKFNADDILDAMVPIYQKYLSRADLDAILTFYESPAGRRLLEKQPLMVQEGMAAGQRVAQEKFAVIEQQMQARVKLLTEKYSKSTTQPK